MVVVIKFYSLLVFGRDYPRAFSTELRDWDCYMECIAQLWHMLHRHTHKGGCEGSSCRESASRSSVTNVPSSFHPKSMQRKWNCNLRLISIPQRAKAPVMMRIHLRQDTCSRWYANSARAATWDYEYGASDTRVEFDMQNQECLGDNRQSHAAKVSQNQPSTLSDRQLQAKRASLVQPDDAVSKAHAV